MHHDGLSFFITFTLAKFEFIACSKSTISRSIINDCFSFNNLNINIDFHHFDSSIYKAFKKFIFDVDVIVVSENINLPYTCTLILTEDFRALITVVSNHRFYKLILNRLNNTNHCFRFIIFDATLLEDYCFKLLQGSSSQSFLATIDIFKFEE
jgi:hypothetical protein